MTFLATELSTKTTFIAERARKGSTKLIWSAMPADRPGPDVIVHKIPLHLRKAAKAFFN